MNRPVGRVDLTWINELLRPFLHSVEHERAYTDALASAPIAKLIADTTTMARDEEVCAADAASLGVDWLASLEQRRFDAFVASCTVCECPHAFWAKDAPLRRIGSSAPVPAAPGVPMAMPVARIAVPLMLPQRIQVPVRPVRYRTRYDGTSYYYADTYSQPYSSYYYTDYGWCASRACLRACRKCGRVWVRFVCAGALV
jgi:hypothetical protein